MKKNLMNCSLPPFSDKEGWRKGGNTSQSHWNLGSGAGLEAGLCVSAQCSVMFPVGETLVSKGPVSGGFLVFALPKIQKKEKVEPKGAINHRRPLA